MLKQENQKKNFQGLGIKPALLERITKMGFVEPTPIQFKAIPIATKGEDVVGIAQTGSGKTLAFSIPMIQTVVATKKMGLILLPTRELAVQVEETLKSIAGQYGLRTAIVIGGAGAMPQIRQLKNKPHIVVATPGRLIDHIENKVISLSNVGMLVLDEADRMLDMGFAPQLKRILSFVPKERQTMLFSATMPEKIAAIAHQYMKEPLRIEVARPGTTADNIDQEVFIVPKDEKMALLRTLLNEHKGSVLVFSRTKHGAKKIADKIRKMGHAADELHSNRSQGQRQKALKGFSTGKYRILVATDIAARGIDVDDIELVVNFDLPTMTEDYTHRIGRTGRAGKSGKAISFAVPEQKGDIALIQQLIKLVLPIKSPCGKMLEPIKASATAQRLNQNTNRGGGRPGNGGYPRNGGRPRHSQRRRR
ncbi:MAG: DEAD/DEAH box helicase [Nitrospirota bacterium]